VLLFDEPTTGLDPTSRQRVWEAARGSYSVRAVTVLLTTQYLDEADTRTNRIVVKMLHRRSGQRRRTI